MQITWHGLNCVRIQGKEATLVVDAFPDSQGPKLPRWQADIVLSPTKESAAVKTAPSAFQIDSPGEYELKEAFVYSVPWKQTKAKKPVATQLYRINIDGVSIAHLGEIDGILESAQLELFEGCDVVILPAGNKEQLTPKEASENVARIEPRVVILVDYAAKGIKAKRETADALVKELGIKPEETDKLKLTKKDLPVDKREVYKLDLA